MRMTYRRIKACHVCNSTDFISNGGTKRRCRDCNRARLRRLNGGPIELPDSFLLRDQRRAEIIDHSQCDPQSSSCCESCLLLWSEVIAENATRSIGGTV